VFVNAIVFRVRRRDPLEFDVWVLHQLVAEPLVPIIFDSAIWEGCPDGPLRDELHKREGGRKKRLPIRLLVLEELRPTVLENRKLHPLQAAS
jgi:hypothetical protein